MENPQKMTTGLPAQPNLPGNSERTENERKLIILLKLGAHFWPHDFTPSQAKAFLADYIEDLSGLTALEVNEVSGEWRRNAENKRFPISGEILRIASQNRHPLGRSRLPTFHGHPEIEGPRAIKTAAQILAEHGYDLPKPPEVGPLPYATDKNGPVTRELLDSKLVHAAKSQQTRAFGDNIEITDGR